MSRRWSRGCESCWSDSGFETPVAQYVVTRSRGQLRCTCRSRVSGAASASSSTTGPSTGSSVARTTGVGTRCSVLGWTVLVASREDYYASRRRQFLSAGPTPPSGGRVTQPRRRPLVSDVAARSERHRRQASARYWLTASAAGLLLGAASGPLRPGSAFAPSWRSRSRISDSRKRRCPPGVRMLLIRPAAAQRVTVFGSTAEKGGDLPRRQQAVASFHCRSPPRATIRFRLQRDAAHCPISYRFLSADLDQYRPASRRAVRAYPRAVTEAAPSPAGRRRSLSTTCAGAAC